MKEVIIMKKSKELIAVSLVPNESGEYVRLDSLSPDEQMRYREKINLRAMQSMVKSYGLKATINEETYTLIIS